MWPFPCRIGRSPGPPADPVLDLRRLEDATVGAAVDHVLSRGIEIDAWVGSCRQSAWERLTRTSSLFGDLTPDGQRGRQPPSLEFLREFRRFWQVLLGCRGDRNVGATLVMARADGEGRVSTFFTGVVPDERSQGWPQC